MKNNKVLTSIVGSTFFKIASAAISFMAVPLLLETLGPVEYATWVTMTTLVTWLNLFDFGSGYSLKNKITEALATNKLNTLQPLLAGTLQFYVIMTGAILICFLASLFLIAVFNSNLLLALIIYLPIILSFPFTLGHFLIQGLKRFNWFNLILLAQSSLWLVIIFVFKQGALKFDIYKLATCYSLLFVLANGTIMFISLRHVPFNLKAVLDIKNFEASKQSLFVGGKFFLLQVSSLFLYSLGNILSYDNLDKLDVTRYDTVNKIFLMGMTIFNVVISVFWTEISHQKALGNRSKLLRLYYQLLLLSAAFSVGCIGVMYIAPSAIKLWTKNMVIVELDQVYPFCILVIVQAFAYVGAVFLNAFEKLRMQIILSVFAAVLMIPLSNYLFTLSIGIGTVPYSAAMLTAPTLVYVLIKSYYTIVNVV